MVLDSGNHEEVGINATWISWIETCISSSSFSIFINGSLFGKFYPERGLRQGDPLSHFLFILDSEVLSRLLFREESIGNIRGMKIARRSPAIHHLLFADDLLIFGKASLLEANSIKSCLDKYCSWPGQSTNSSTSSSILNILPYNSNPSCSIYLGLPILIGRSKSAACQSILDKVRNRIEGWRAKTLSQAGRLVLIKAVTAAIPSYAMGTFLLPTSICKKLDQMFKNFLWGFPPTKAINLSLKSWDSLCMPRDARGLGFRKMKEVNLALISKLGLKLQTNSDSMWVNQLEGVIPDTATLASSIKKSTLSHAAAWKSSSPRGIEVWSPPQEGYHMINFNTVIREHLSTQAAVCKNHKGKIIKVISLISPSCTPNIRKALATLLAASLAVSLKLKNFTIEGDSLIVIIDLQHPSIIQD
ncbi:uncharacterized protein LOC132178252 [Corylus avellana]|uniref:uncharacterized protein LOC132178252 n=1 Tax=Corylus avellana TaxID=13451 RepID=UPI00286B0738|nr:uncharacterized protein LOC132178252 [Corylus avellana]